MSARLPRTEAAPELRQHRSAPRTGLDRTGYKGLPSNSQRQAPAGIHWPLCPQAVGGGHRLSPGLRSFPSSRILPVTWSARGGSASPRPSAIQARPLLPAGSGRESGSPGQCTARVSEGLPDGQMDSPSPCYWVCPAVESVVQGEHVTPTAAARNMTASTCDRWRPETPLPGHLSTNKACGSPSPHQS